MKKYFKYFMKPFIALGVIVILFIVMMVVKNVNRNYLRHNSMCETTKRVFDYADLLTKEEEVKLEQLIARAEDEAGADIVIVNLNESLEEFANQYSSYAPISSYTMIFADEFYEQHVFGYNEPYGDGVIYVDNRYREADGYMYTWMGTTGKVEDIYSSEMIDDLLYETEEYLDSDTYKAYEVFVEGFVKDIKKEEGMQFIFTPAYLFMGFFVCLVFLIVTKGQKNNVTTTEKTFLGYQHMNEARDEYINKSVTSRLIQTSSSGGSSGRRSGGGGHHRSRSGRSHGGGGRRR